MNYNQPNKEFAKKFFDIVEKSKNIYITSHIGEDPDSIASVLAVYKILTKKYPNKKITSVYTGKRNEKYTVFKDFNEIKYVPDITEKIEKGSLLIMLDGSQFSRFSHQPEKLEKLGGKTICIDHHSSPIDNFDLSLVDPTAPSTAEIIYLLFSQDKNIDKDLAETYLLGIIEDTGNFAFLKPSQANTLIIAKNLIEIAGVEIQEFQARYNFISKRVFNIVQQLIKNTEFHQRDNWPNFQTSFISQDFKQTGEYTDNEMIEAYHLYMSQYIRKIEDYTWGFVITPLENGTSTISLRSLPNSVNVRNIVEQMGIGGGHDRAAGGEFDNQDVKKCMKQMFKWIRENKPRLS
jgi:nanoRNase/pAp phosphatase (c-di-AMP/oligoRNAs hydrolase)